MKILIITCDMFNALKMNVYLVAYVLFFTLFFSCQSTTQQEINIPLLQVETYIRYLQSEKQLKTEISFSEIDSTKKMIPKIMDEVLFLKKAMDGKKVQNQFRYQLSQTVSFSEKYSFEFSSKGSLLQELIIRINPIEDFFIKGGTISKSQGTTLIFKGKLLKSNENLILLFSDEKNKTTTIAIVGPSDDLGISILPKQLKELTLGKGELYLVRRQIIKEKKKSLNITGLTEYYSKVINIEVLE